MTKDEFRRFAREAIGTADTERQAIDRITDQWESDVNDARIAGQDEAIANSSAYHDLS